MDEALFEEEPIITEELIGRLWPEILPENRKGAAKNLEGYLEITLRMWERISQDPEAMKRLRATVLEKSWR